MEVSCPRRLKPLPEGRPHGRREQRFEHVSRRVRASKVFLSPGGRKVKLAAQSSGWAPRIALVAISNMLRRVQRASVRSRSNACRAVR